MTKDEELQNRIDTAIQLRDAAYRVCADYQRQMIELRQRLGDIIMACEVFANRVNVDALHPTESFNMPVTAGEVQNLQASISMAKARL